jgi:hypothetical protein
MIIGPKLLKVFGFSAEKVRRFSITCDVNESATLKIEYVAEYNDETEELEEVVKTFEMVEK